MTASVPHIYVESDVPDGLTLVEWRRSRRVTEPRSPRFLRRLRRVHN
jgi:hypothetical protein